MSNQNKGFDPLSSLFFELPGSSDEIPFEDDFGDIGERTAPIPTGHVEMTDPVFSPPPDMSMPPMSGEVLEVTIHTDELSKEEARNIITPPIPDRPARRSALFRPPRQAVLDEPSGPSPAEQAQIAKAVAAAALAKAKSAAPAPEEKAGPSANEQAQIAKAVAAAALAKAQAASTAATGSAAPAGRLTGIASRAGRPMSALEAARAAAAAEEQSHTTSLEREKAENAEKERAAIAKVLAAAALEKAQAEAAPAPEDPTAEQAAIAKAVVAAALARAQSAAPPESPSPEEQARIARKLAVAAIAKAQTETTPEDDASSAEQAAIAKAVAATAIARAQGNADPDVSPAVEEKPKTRLESLAARARRPRSALDAAREAAREETKAAEERKAAEIRRKANFLTDKIQALIPAWLPGVGTYYVANAIITNERAILKVLWKAHRAKFLSDGHLERAVGVASVLHALENTGQGELVAAHVVTDASDYLLWMDLGSDSLVAAFADARAWFAPRE